MNASLISGLDGNPVSIAVSGSNLFVSNTYTIGKYTMSGEVVNASLITGFDGPEHRRVRIEPIRLESLRQHDWRIYHVGSSG